MTVLVTGGAGYIGSVTVELLRMQGLALIVLDSLLTGHRDALAPDVAFVEGDIANEALVEEIVQRFKVTACIHFAARSIVSESVAHPDLYFEHNLQRSTRLFGALRRGGVRHIVFSSTAAVYGEPRRIPIDENHPTLPTNPYGASKLAVERVLRELDQQGMRHVALRYFNAAGATDVCGEDHHPETHLIPNAIRGALNLISELPIFGADFPTTDGTAIRDYVHVVDLADAHLRALSYLRAGGMSIALNLGTGRGYSVRQVIDTIARVTGRPIRTRVEARRSGDPSELVADPSRAQHVLGWCAPRSSLDEMVNSAWRWHRDRPHGYSMRAAHSSQS